MQNHVIVGMPQIGVIPIHGTKNQLSNKLKISLIGHDLSMIYSYQLF